MTKGLRVNHFLHWNHPFSMLPRICIHDKLTTSSHFHLRRPRFRLDVILCQYVLSPTESCRVYVLDLSLHPQCRLASSISPASWTDLAICILPEEWNSFETLLKWYVIFAKWNRYSRHAEGEIYTSFSCLWLDPQPSYLPRIMNYRFLSSSVINLELWSSHVYTRGVIVTFDLLSASRKLQFSRCLVDRSEKLFRRSGGNGKNEFVHAHFL